MRLSPTMCFSANQGVTAARPAAMIHRSLITTNPSPHFQQPNRETSRKSWAMRNCRFDNGTLNFIVKEAGNNG